MTLRFGLLGTLVVLLTACSRQIAAPDVDSGADAGPPRPAPRPVSPSTASRVTSHRPTLRVAPAPDSTGTRVEVCRDRGCTTVVASFDAAEGSGRPADPLEPGVYFWRARALRDGTPARETGPTWEFFVGPRDSEVDTSWGTVADYNGDGYADLNRGLLDHADPASRDEWVYPGGPAGVSDATRVRLALGSSALGHDPLRALGDVNGDGFVDAGAVFMVDGAGGAVFRVFFGGPGGLDATRVAEVAVPRESAEQPGVNNSLYLGADVNADGYADLCSWYRDPSEPRRRHFEVRAGGPAGLSSDVSFRLEEPEGVGSVWGASAPQDFDGDGRLDAVATFLAYGDPAGTPPSRVALYGGPWLGQFARWLDCDRCGPSADVTDFVRSVGDVDGDGYADALATRWVLATGGEEPGFQTLHGGPDGLSTTEPVQEVPLAPADLTASNVFVLGDLDGNGTADVVSADLMNNGDLVLRQWLDPASGAAGVRAVVVAQGASPGLRPEGVGDVDGDGRDDVLVGARLFYGSPQGVDADHVTLVNLFSDADAGP